MSDNEDELKEVGFNLNWEKIRETECHKKTENLLSIFGSNYWDIVESESMGSTIDI